VTWCRMDTAGLSTFVFSLSDDRTLFIVSLAPRMEDETNGNGLKSC
jgi:hypothetical protein